MKSIIHPHLPYTTMSGEMLTANVGGSYPVGKWKCGDVVWQVGGSHKTWIGFCMGGNFVVSPGQMRVILVVTVEGAKVSVHTFGAIEEGMLMLWTFLTCCEHLLVMLAAFWHIRLWCKMEGWKAVEEVH